MQLKYFHYPWQTFTLDLPLALTPGASNSRLLPVVNTGSLNWPSECRGIYSCKFPAFWVGKKSAKIKIGEEIQDNKPVIGPMSMCAWMGKKF